MFHHFDNYYHDIIEALPLGTEMIWLAQKSEQMDFELGTTGDIWTLNPAQKPQEEESKSTHTDDGENTSS